LLLAAFRSRFPEFSTCPDATVSAVLTAAATELNSTEIGAPYDEAHGLLAAHKLAISPYGRAARMLNEQGHSTYEAEFSNVMARAIPGIAVAGCL
jgi:hypothetical protein